MPKISQKSYLQDITYYCWFESIAWPKIALLGEEEIVFLQACLDSQRYSVERLVGVKDKPIWWQAALFDPTYQADNFKSHFRMNVERFWTLNSRISENSIFESSCEPVHLQLAITLYRLGCFGNVCSFQQVATRFGIAEGSVLNFTERVIEALTSLTEDYISWPNSDERKHIGDYMAKNLLPKCQGFVDGSDAVLHCAPTHNKETYWSRKKKYCLQFQIVCDPYKRVRDFFVGFPGSVHDSKVYRTSPLGLNPDRFFSNGEFIVGDSAYALTDTVIVPYRRSAAGLSRIQKQFNHHVSTHRVSVEHTIGILKGRFQSLRGLRILIKNTEGHKRACKWIHACVILHNFLLGDGWNEIDMPVDQNEELNAMDGNVNVIQGQQKRQALLEIYQTMNS